MSDDPATPPQQPDKRSHFARFDEAMGKLLSVPKSEIDKRLAEEKKAREKKKKA
jgi:hypothetical protein